jgi:argininosuccinate synthase
LVLAHRELEALCLDRETAHFSQMLSLRYAELVYYGLWFTQLREALDAYFTAAQERVTGTVGLQLYKGGVVVTRRASPNSLYQTDLASFSMDRYNPKDAEGFINLFALPVTRPARRAAP